MKPSEVLIGARDHIINIGWEHNNMTGIGPNNERCALMAMCKFEETKPECYEEVNQAEIFFRSANDMFNQSVADWNDDPRRTEQDVINAFDRAITLALKDNQ